MTEDRTPKVADEPSAAARQRPERKKRKWDQSAEDLVSAAATAAAVAGLPLMNISALPGVAPPGSAAATLPSVVPVPYALPPQIAPSVLQNAAAVVQKLSQAKLPDEVIAREIVINDADPSVRYKLTKRQTQEEIQRCTSTVIITRGKYQPPNGQPNGEKPLYLHISAGSQPKDTAERIKAVDRAASMIEEIMKQCQISETASVPFPSGCGQAVHPFSASIFLGFDADPLLNIAARIRGPNDQYLNHIKNETGIIVVLRGKDSWNLGSFHGEASQQPLHLYLTGMNLKSLEAAKVLAENLLDTIAAECGASRISSSKVYGAVPPPQQLLTGVHTSGIVSDSYVHSTLEPSVLTGASHSFASSGIAASPIVPSEALQSVAPTYVVPPCNVTCPSPPVNDGTFYSGYGNIYPQATPLQQVASTLKHSISSTTQVVPVTSILTSTTINAASSSDLETDKRSQRRKFQELPVSKGPTAEFQNSQQGSKFVKTGLGKFGNVRSSSIAHLNKVQPVSDGMLPSNRVDMPSHLSAPNKMAATPSNIMTPPPSRNMLPPPPPPHQSMPPPPPQMSMPPPPLKFPSGEMMSRKENTSLVSSEPVAPSRSLNTISVSPPKLCAQLPAKEPSDRKPKVTPVSDTILKLMDYGDEDDDDIDATDSPLQGNSGQ